MSDEHPDMELLEKHVAQLGEHFDTVHVFATRYVSDESDDDCGTVNVNVGTGNWFARFGQVSEWLIKSNERTKALVRREEKEGD